MVLVEKSSQYPLVEMFYKNVSHWSISVFNQLSIPDVFPWSIWSQDFRFLYPLSDWIEVHLGSSWKGFSNSLTSQKVDWEIPLFTWRCTVSTSVIINSQRKGEKENNYNFTPYTISQKRNKEHPSPTKPQHHNVNHS